MFLILMVIGLSGLVVMAVPAFTHHGAIGKLGGTTRALHAAQVGKLAASQHALTAATPPGHDTTIVPADPGARWTRLVPSPRLVFSLLALFGAFGNAFVAAAGLAPLAAALAAIVPTVLVERFAVTPVWRLVFRFQAEPSSPLEACILSEARAVTAFRNGRGIVSVVRDGRAVQFSGSLTPAQAHLPVRVGDRLRVEDVDAKRERLTLSLVEE
jgi:hypothetical protein